MDDTIRRQAAIDAICNDCCGGRYDCKYYPKCDNLESIQNLPSAQPGPRWIPCAERKPTKSDYKDGVVLACHENGQIKFNAFMNGEWVTGEPIAWMPLPEPYEEEQDEQGAG